MNLQHAERGRLGEHAAPVLFRKAACGASQVHRSRSNRGTTSRLAAEELEVLARLQTALDEVTVEPLAAEHDAAGQIPAAL